MARREAMIIHIVLVLILFLGILFGDIIYKIIRKGGIADRVYNVFIVAMWAVIWICLPVSGQPRLCGAYVLPLQIIGAILALSGFAIGGLAAQQRKALGYERTRLCCEGIYCVIRHPIYIGWFVFYVGWSLIWRAIYSLCFIPVMFLLVYLEAFLEEKYMVGREFKEQYENYKKKVGMFFPRILKSTKAKEKGTGGP